MQEIENMIYEINGKQVMLDSDIANLYQCKNGTKEINQAVKNNIEKFPNEYAFRINENEYNSLKSKVLTSKGGSRKGHTVFTEHGIIMLATILKSEIAIKMSIKVINVFVSMRKYIGTNLLEQKYINNMVFEHDNEIKLLQESFDKLEEKRVSNEIYFNGMIYDAYSKILDIFSKTKKELIIIDSYADKVILDIIRRLKIKAIIITKEDNLLTKQDIETYNKQYNNLKVIYNNTFHDRYFILDKKIVYHCGTSINRIGYKTFSINLISDKDIINTLLNKI